MIKLDKHIEQGLRDLASPEHAQAYAATQDKYIYARDTIVMALGQELPLNLRISDETVEAYETLLESQAIEEQHRQQWSDDVKKGLGL